MSLSWRTIRPYLWVIIPLLAIYLCNSQFAEYDDEWDNILGGKLIAQGEPIYEGFFSHHFPLPYFISAFIHLFIDTDAKLFRLGFTLLLWLWSSALYLYCVTKQTRLQLSILCLSLAVISPVAWMHMLLAETLIAYATLSIVLVLVYRPTITSRDLCLMLLCASVIGLSSLGYIFLLLLIYAIVFYLLIKRRELWGRRNLSNYLAWAAAPYLAFLLYAAYNGALEQTYFQTITFNTKHYFHFAGNPPSSPLLSFLYVCRNVFQQIGAVLGNPLAEPHGRLLLPLFIFGGALVSFLALQRRLVVAICVGLTVFFSLSRFGAEFDFANNRNTPFYPLALLGFALTVDRLVLLARTAKFNVLNSMLAVLAVYLIVIFTSTLVDRAWTIYADVADGNRRIPNRDPLARQINKMLKEGERYWVAPFHFRTQYFVRNKRSTRYTFYLAWHGASERINSDIVETLDRERPILIYFDSNLVIWNNSPEVYGKDVLAYIRKNYRPLNREHYFRRIGSRLDK